MKRHIYIWIIVLQALFAQSNNDLFSSANELYKMNDYQSAIRNYEQILSSSEHEDIYYNLGNAYFRNGDIGKSVWAFEKAFILDPRDPDIKFNLDYLRSLVRDRIIAPKDLFLLSMYKKTIEKFTLSDLLFISGALLLLLSIIYFLVEFSYLSKKISKYLKYFSTAALIFFAWMVLDKYWSLSDRSYGIVLAPAVDVRSAPVMRGQNVVFRIHEGTKVEIQNSELGWNEIILLDGKKGWILSEDIKEL